jgi:CO/xanthine dehydrogenase Mo-binding subunit/aerobic-type carbon monoxide dehydrogenase small subunit (CoxS/CutS family)
MDIELHFRLNGSSVCPRVSPTERLSVVVREHLGLKGTKVGCDAGDCGACTVLIDGEPCCSCMVPAAQVAGCDVTTVEGLQKDDRLSWLQEAFLHMGAAQCGICTPGMLMAANALLNEKPHPTRSEVQDALAGVLCRCTGYAKIVDAVMQATGFNGLAETPDYAGNVGAAIRRVDGAAKVRGDEVFSADGIPDDALWVRVLRSPHHFTDFAFGDLEGFVAAREGIEFVLTARDVPGMNCFGVIPPFADQPVLAEKTARYRGEAVAAVVGEKTAIRALDLNEVPVTWTPRPAMLNPADALATDAPRLHPDRDGNLLIRGLVERGDFDDGLAAAAHVAEGAFSTPFVEHAYIEPEAGYAVRNGDQIEIYGGTQAPFLDREGVAACLAMAEEDVRIIPTACGGGFGSKLDISMQPYIALAALRCDRPVAIVYTRQESMQSTTKRHPSEISAKIGCAADGRITAMDFEGEFNTGAYASWGPTVANRVPVHACGPYFTPNYRARSIAVLTNCPPAGAFRGFGVPQAAIAQECLYDELADKAGIDRLEFRLINALQNGQPTVTGQVFNEGVGITACLEALRRAWQAALPEVTAFNASVNGSGVRRGVGVASCWYGCGNTSLPNPSTIRIGITRQGRIVLHQGAADIGQGANTVIAQIAAQALGVPVHQLELVGPDTGLTPDGGKTSASRQTYVTGSAAKLAGAGLRQRILAHAKAGADAVVNVGAGEIVLRDGAEVARIDLTALETDNFGYVFRGEETYDPPTTALDESGQGIPYAVFGYGAQMVELSVDLGLGTVKLEKLTAAHDVGRAINPVLVEGQIEGGSAQGIGMALMEEYIPGRTENLHDYLIPTFGDVPQVENIIIEVADPEGPYGAKGLGEHVLIPTAPAILNAIRHATGATLRDLPATPDKVLKAIQSVRN